MPTSPGRRPAAPVPLPSTGQQLAISFGVAGASLIAALFVPTGLHTHAATMIYGVQQAFLILGIMTVLSSVVFMELKRDDGNDISRHDSAPSHETHD